jgi:hypothetical protein
MSTVTESPTMLHVAQYFDRAAWALQNTANDSLPLNVRSHLSAIAVHACQSLKEAFDRFSEDNSADIDLVAAIKNLPHTELIENVRNMDLHGWPLPVCDPKVRMVAMVSKPGKPIALSSSKGVPIAMTMAGVAPKVHNPNRKCANVKFGGATISFGCDQGQLVVHDFSANKQYLLHGVIEAFLRACIPIINNRMSKPDGETDATPDTGAKQDGFAAQQEPISSGAETDGLPKTANPSYQLLNAGLSADKMSRMTSINGHFDGKAVVLDEPLPLTLAVGQQVRVIVDAPAANAETAPTPPALPRKSLAGFAKGMFEMRDDFNDPLDEFAEYR